MNVLDHVKPAGLGVALLTLWCGCASSNLTAQVMPATEAAIENARSSGADIWAPAAFSTALEKADEARGAAQDGKEAKARRLAAQATADAELAEASARAAATRNQIKQVRAGTDSLRQTLGAGPP